VVVSLIHRPGHRGHAGEQFTVPALFTVNPFLPWPLCPADPPESFSLPDRGWGYAATLTTMPARTARKRPELPPDATLLDRVQETLGALQLGPEDSAVVGLALKLAEAVDGMDEDTRGRMVAQTAPQLLAVLRELRERSHRHEHSTSSPYAAPRSTRWAG
jgi:hypothetical protein